MAGGRSRKTDGMAATIVASVKEHKDEANELKFNKLCTLLGSEEAAWRALRDGRKNVTMRRSLRRLARRRSTALAA